MKTYKFIIVAFLGGLAFVSLGCIDCETIEMHYKISDDLKGELTVIFWGVHSWSYPTTTLESQKKEMKAFYDGGYLNGSGYLQKWFGMDSSEVELFDKTDTECNAKINGKILWFPSSLATTISDEADFVLQKAEDRLYVSIGIAEDSNDCPLSIFTLEYEGEIIAHNASNYDTTSNLLQWERGKIQSPGIYFVLDTNL